MTWRWNAFSMRLTPTRPSRTRSELSREGIAAASSPDHIGSGKPVVKATLLAVETDPQKSQKQRRDTREVARTPREAAGRRGRIAVDVNHLHLQEPHAERTAEHDVKHDEIRHPDREHQHEPHHERRI